MSTALTATTLVRDAVVRFPALRKVLESLGIDYCCGGQHSLAEAARAAGLDVTQVLAAANGALADSATATVTAEPEYGALTLTALAEHIQDTHHAFLRRHLPGLEALFGKVMKAHREKHGGLLRQMHEVFTGLRLEILAHLTEEERVLFPYIERMEAEQGSAETVTPSPCGTIRSPIRQMEAEHESAGAALAALRRISDGYALPEDACPSFAALYDGLQELEADLHQHIHLENNILFPRALAMAEAA
jgi:regulator of cell morphogenesis and NO signaling